MVVDRLPAAEGPAALPPVPALLTIPEESPSGEESTGSAQLKRSLEDRTGGDSPPKKSASFFDHFALCFPLMRHDY